MDKTEIVSNYESFLCGTINRDVYEAGTTGGTSGKPLTCIATKKRYVVEMATMHSLWARKGYDFTVRAVIRNHRMANGRQLVINPLTREIIIDGFRLTPDYFSIIYRTIRVDDWGEVLPESLRCNRLAIGTMEEYLELGAHMYRFRREEWD